MPIAKKTALPILAVVAILVVLGLGVAVDATRSTQEAGRAEPYRGAHSETQDAAYPLRDRSQGERPKVAYFYENRTEEPRGQPGASTGAMVSELQELTGWDVYSFSPPGPLGYVSSNDTGANSVLELLKSSRLSQFDPDLVIIQAGRRDRGKLARQVVPAVQHSIDEVRHEIPGVPIAVVGLIWGSEYKPPTVVSTYRQIADVAINARDVVFIDTYDLVLSNSSPADTVSDEDYATISAWIADKLQSAGVLS